MDKSKTRLIILDVSEAQSQVMRDEYGQYRFLTFCQESSRLLKNYVQSTFNTDLKDYRQRDVKGYISEWYTGFGVSGIDKQQLDMIFDTVIILQIRAGENYDYNYYAQPSNGGYVGWLNEKVKLDEFFEE